MNKEELLNNIYYNLKVLKNELHVNKHVSNQTYYKVVLIEDQFNELREVIK